MSDPVDATTGGPPNVPAKQPPPSDKRRTPWTYKNQIDGWIVTAVWTLGSMMLGAAIVTYVRHGTIVPWLAAGGIGFLALGWLKRWISPRKPLPPDSR
jgi:hypothetical protein